MERLAAEKGASQDRPGAGFAKIEIGAGMGSAVAREYGIRVTPTFLFFLDGEKVCLCLSGKYLIFNEGCLLPADQ